MWAGRSVNPRGISLFDPATGPTDVGTREPVPMEREASMATDDKRQDVLLEEYRRVVDQFRALTEIRFKLLAYLPLVTVAAVAVAKDTQWVTKPAVAAFGLVVTLCVATYNKRNDQHYDELVGRAAQLEREELGLPYGSFAQRPTTWLSYGGVRVEHRWPIGLLYASAAALWAYFLTQGLMESFNFESPNPFRRLPDPLSWLPVAASALCILVWLALKSIENNRGRRLRCAVVCLMSVLLSRDEGQRGQKCERLAGKIARYGDLFDIDEEVATRRLAFHRPAVEGPLDTRTAGLLLAAIIDLPARWIEDVYTGRR
jgi:hypothetical protein